MQALGSLVIVKKSCVQVSGATSVGLFNTAPAPGVLAAICFAGASLLY